MTDNSYNNAHTLYCCYIDESGTSEIPGNSSHFVLAGLTLPIYQWKKAERDIDTIKKKYDLLGKEIHTGWLIREYKEQNKIVDFATLSRNDRRSQVTTWRLNELYRLQKGSSANKQYAQIKKNFNKTEDYIHLSFQERKDFVLEVAKTVGSWGFARVFAECVDKSHFSPTIAKKTLDEHAFEQLVTRFELFLKAKGNIRGAKDSNGIKNYGMLIHDNNPTVEKKHTELMKRFYQKGTSWAKVENIIETPLFVNSSLTSMIQLTDVCAYAIRRFLEYGETLLFNEIYKRADSKFISGTTKSVKVGIRHFASSCTCVICKDHTQASASIVTSVV
jgi:hypothetical protein